MGDEHSMSHVSTNYLPVETDIEMRGDPPPSKTSTWRVNFYKYRPFVVHFALTVLVASICLSYLDHRTFNVNSRRPQYREVDGSVAYASFYAPLQSDITTAVSLAATITRVAGGWWATGYIWRSAFVAMEQGGISTKGLSQAISNCPPAPRHFTRKSNMVIIYVALFATFAIDYFSAALTGSFIWETAVTQVPGKILLNGITDGTVLKKQSISDSVFIGNDLINYESEIMMMASASASIAWGTSQPDSILNITEPSTTFRRVINGAQYLSTHSILANVTMPYFAVDAFEWVRDPHQVLTDGQLSLLYQNASGYSPFLIRANGTGGLLPDGQWGNGPMIRDPHMPISETRLFTFRIWIPWSYPTTAAPLCPQNYTIDPGLVINFISGSDYPDGRDCFAIANVSYRAGVISSQNCKIISANVVEAQAPYPIIGNFQSAEALGIAPLLAANFFLSNYAIPLNFGTNRNLGIELASRAYQAAWAALADYYTASANATTVQIALPTLRAEITHWRVYLWVALHLWVLALGLLFAYIQSRCDHPWVEDPTMAVFWLDTTAALQRVSDPWQPGRELREGGMLILEYNEAGQWSVQDKRSTTSSPPERRYSHSIPLQPRMPPSSSTITEEENGELGVEMFARTSAPTTLHHTSSSDTTRTPENFAK
ncbi:uncharacterized protein LACBIDRAFT_331186 [Laccaria bicolor S238N-H82]|uniref:Predicted protein n=1 Tax=Laccaria bicolor (strain S238N-H82 / ATCC MYA-4686) TaxID=486041 RepID=B0DNQ6_LACBS|nr:uncharacterized protein LACBIDRAFT_331186 [Laccaria bicolor S238N-H82]EDR03766.1 predicted protein [Laccaria bicolor S238N-H82]|eukprot:XP_001885619.1 predicted protein [Laccaria bicolor S238N-H82]